MDTYLRRTMHPLRAIETTGTLDDEGRLHLDAPLSVAGQQAVRVIVLLSGVDLRARGIGKAEAAELRRGLAPFAEDWESPEMDLYDDYDAARAHL